MVGFKSLHIIVAAALTFAGVAFGQTNTTANSTTTGSGNGLVGWVSPDSQRSTSGIIWSCLSVFIVCSWKCVHLNLPSEEESLGEWHSFRCLGMKIFYWPKRPTRIKWGRQLTWMAIISIAPEIGVGLAVKQWTEAGQDCANVKNILRVLGPTGESDVTRTHGFYARMGGFRVLSERESRERAVLSDPAGSHPALDSETPGERQTLQLVFIKSLLDIEGHNLLITKEDIMDRSKADGFTKIFALVQASWLVIQSIARAAQGLTISELELTTIAFVLCAFIMYLFWWDKPFGAERPDVIWRGNIAKKDGGKLEAARYLRDSMFRVPELETETFVDLLFDFSQRSAYALYVTSTAFSAIHVVAWDWHFPSPLTQTLWRSFSLVALSSALIPVVIGILVSMLVQEDTALEAIFIFIARFSLISYIFSRLGLIFLVFYCFSAMPSSVYEPLEWTGFIPHFS